MQAIARSINAPLRALAVKSIPKPVAALAATRALSTSSRAFSDAPPSIFGEGSKAGQVPTDLEQATGLERLQLLGQIHGIDVFNTGPIVVSKPGTIEEPTLVPAYHHERIVGCTGFPTDSHDAIWMEVNDKKEFHRCVECGHVFKLQYLGGADHHDHGHH